jgi:hypothetical protein
MEEVEPQPPTLRTALREVSSEAVFFYIKNIHKK